MALRINLNAGVRFVDVLAAFAQQAKPLDYLYRELQFGLRAAVGTLDELLEDKGSIDRTVAEHIGARARSAGMEVASVGVKDIILPGEMKTILARVVEAEKAAQANVIRRREETAATRSLLNTAKVMEDNPIALRMKELETLEKVTEKIDKISVYGGLDSVLKDLVKIRACLKEFRNLLVRRCIWRRGLRVLRLISELLAASHRVANAQDFPLSRTRHGARRASRVSALPLARTASLASLSDALRFPSCNDGVAPTSYVNGLWAGSNDAGLSSGLSTHAECLNATTAAVTIR